MKFILDSDTDAAIILDDENVFLSATTLANFGQVISASNSSFDTGFMGQEGTGILSYRVNGEYAQLAYQEEPGKRLVKWGQYERSTDAKVFELEHPYKIWIADFHKDMFRGMRHFVSPTPIQDIDQPLYAFPLPNTNCKGYNGTSVGWICNYMTGTEPLFTVQDKLNYAYQRESGISEPYNNANMSGTDGPRFYDAKGIKLFSSGDVWVKAQEAGIDWASVLIPIKIASTDEMHCQHNESGEIYTFEDALDKPYYPYYPNNLSTEEKKFYATGWLKAAGSLGEFDSKTLSRLGVVDPPKGLDVDAILAGFSIRRKNSVDFEVFDHDVAHGISDMLFNSRKRCVLCGNHKGELMQLVDTFGCHTITTEDEKRFRYNLTANYILHRFAINPSVKDEMFDVCGNCNAKGLAVAVPFEGDPNPENNDILDIEMAYVLTEKGYQIIQNSGEDLSQRYLSPDKPAFNRFSHYVVSVQNDLGKIPYTHVATCLECKRHYNYEMDADGNPELDKWGVIAGGTKLKANQWEHYNMVRCNQCIPKTSLFIASNEENVMNLGICPFVYDPANMYEGKIQNDLSVDVLFEGGTPQFVEASSLWVAEILSEQGHHMVVDEKEKLLNLERCQCGFSVLEGQMGLQEIAHCEYKVCAECVVDCKYRSIIDF